jgi:hypothetical protein
MTIPALKNHCQKSLNGSNKLGKTHGWAELIAIKDYSLKKNGFRPLPYAIYDAKEVKKYLIDILGFDRINIFTLYDH